MATPAARSGLKAHQESATFSDADIVGRLQYVQVGRVENGGHSVWLSCEIGCGVAGFVNGIVW